MAVIDVSKALSTVEGATIYGTSEDDSLIGTAGTIRHISISGGLGDDTIVHDNPLADILYADGDGNDVIDDYVYAGTIRLTSGRINSTQVSGRDIILKVGSGSLTVKTTSFEGERLVRVQDPTGNFTVYHDSSTIGKGFDNIYANGNSNKRITGSGGNDLVYNVMAANATINTGAGDDLVYNLSVGFDAQLNRINTGAGNDTIKSIYDKDYNYDFRGINNYYGTFIEAGDGNDVIDCYYDAHDTIIGGRGNDTLYYCGDVIIYNEGDGDDVVCQVSHAPKLIIPSGVYSTMEVDNDVIVNVDNGSITFKDFKTSWFYRAGISISNNVNITLPDTVAASPSTVFSDTISTSTPVNNTIANKSINGTADSDSITNNAEFVTISSGAGSDTIDSKGDDGYIDGGNGNDNLHGDGNGVTLIGGSGIDSIRYNGGNQYDTYHQSWIDGGADNDSIVVSDSNVSIYAGEGNDIVNINGNYKNVSVAGGAGNDYIYLGKGTGTYHNEYTPHITYYHEDKSAIIYKYTSGDGNDTLFNYDETDTLQVAGSRYSTFIDSNDMVVKVGSGSIRVVNAANKKLNIVTIVGGAYVPPKTVQRPEDAPVHETNYTNNVVFNGSSHKDTINNYADNVTINGYDGADRILAQGSVISIDGGEGDDRITILDQTGGSTANGGSGNDYISAHLGNYNTLTLPRVKTQGFLLQ